MINGLTKILAVMLAAMGILMLPELVLHQGMGLQGVIFSARYIGLLALIISTLLFAQRLLWAQITLTLIAVIFLMQFAHTVYFGRALDPFAFELFGSEIVEITEAVLGALPSLWWVLPLALLPPWIAYQLIKRFRPRRTIPLLGILPLFIFAFGIYRPVQFENAIRAFPNVHQPVIENFLTAFGGYVFLLALSDQPRLPDYAPYHIKPAAIQPAHNTTVVVLYGESLGVRHFSALGYGRETTPNLERLAQQPNSVVRSGIAAGIATRISTPLFLNLVRDPRDRENSLKGHANLFKLAQQQGFETYYFSAQRANLLASVETGFIDRFITKDSNPELFRTRWDEGLVDLVAEEIDFSMPKKRLIVLHTRSAHYPYAKNYRFRPELAIYPDDPALPHTELMRNQYDNAVRYSDFVLGQLHNTLFRAASGSVYFWMTSDHGELIGAQGQFGHSLLNLPSVEVPIGLFGRDVDPALLRDFSAETHLTHWDLGRYVLRTLGLELIDPNPNPQERYVAGSGNFARHGMLILEPRSPEGWDVDMLSCLVQ